MSFEKSTAIDSGEKVEKTEGKSRTPAADYDHLAKQFVALDRVSEAAASTKVQKPRSLMASWYKRLPVHIRHKAAKIYELLFGASATEEAYEMTRSNSKAKENE